MKIANPILSFLKFSYLAETYTLIKPKTFLILLFLTLAIIVPYVLILEAVGINQFDNLIEQMLKDNKWLVVILAFFLAINLECKF